MLRGNSLASAAGLDRGRRVAASTCCSAGRAAPRRPAGPGRLLHGWVARPGSQGGDHVGPSPVDRARPGSKRHLIVDRHGTPVAITLTGGNRHDVTQLMPLLDSVPPVRGLRGRPRRKPRRLYADRGYDFDKYRRAVESWHQADDRRTRRGPRLRTGQGALGGRVRTTPRVPWRRGAGRNPSARVRTGFGGRAPGPRARGCGGLAR